MASASDVWLEFCVDDLCGLCGNSGVVRTQWSAADPRMHFVEAYCICPIGRGWKRVNEGLTKWGGSSVLLHQRGNHFVGGKGR